ncbi:hypothetical protein HQ529_05600 [Candidatus Woesearchaeota archaeon]|nr:hypothetical protein [Candidatus Woesearchaeota archaeon]
MLQVWAATHYINKMKKRADISMQMVIGLIVVLALMLVLMLFQARVDKLKDEKLGTAICKSTVFAYSKSRSLGMEFGSEINCPSENLVIPESDDEIIMDKIAMAMYKCFDQFHRGELNLFSNDYKEEKHCAVCSVIEFGDKEKKISSDRFRRYLKTHNIPTGEMSFEEFFVGYSTYDESEPTQTIFPDINTEMDYSTLFVYGKEGYMSKWASGALGGSLGTIIFGAALIPFTGGGSALVGVAGAAGGASGAILGYTMGSDKTADWNSSLVLTPYIPEILYNLSCTYLPVGQERNR